MAKFYFTAHFSSDPDGEYEIDDAEFMNLNDEEIADVVNKHHSQWVTDVAASEIDGDWEEIEE